MMNRYSSVVSAVALALALASAAMAAEPSAPHPRPLSQKARGVSATELPPPKLIPKPVDRAAERRARTQPAAPDGAKEVPFVETAPEPALTDAEKQRGYLLFARPTRGARLPQYPPAAGGAAGGPGGLRHARPVRAADPGPLSRPPAGEPEGPRLAPGVVRRRNPRRLHRRAAGHLLERRLPELHHGENLPPHAGTPGARDRPLLARRRVPAILAHDPCSRRRQAGPLPGNGHRLGRRLRPGAEASPSPCGSSASTCKRTRPSTTRPISTRGTKPSTKGGARPSFARPPTTTTGPWPTSAWTCCQHFT